jgi:hypothetical protein
MEFGNTTRIGKGFELEVISVLLKTLSKNYDVFLPASDDNGCDCLILNNQNGKTVILQIKAKQDQNTDKITFGNINKQAPENTVFLFYFQHNWCLIPIAEFNFSKEKSAGLVTISKLRFNDERFLLKNGLSDLCFKITEILN